MGNTIGQANAVSDKELDLRQCKLAKADLSGKTLAGALLVDADLEGANLQEAVLTKVYVCACTLQPEGPVLCHQPYLSVLFCMFAPCSTTQAYAVSANFSGADMTNAVVDRVVFDKANLKGVVFKNAVITGATFEDADLTATIFEDALIGSEDAKRLCVCCRDC